MGELTAKAMKLAMGAGSETAIVVDTYALSVSMPSQLEERTNTNTIESFVLG